MLFQPAKASYETATECGNYEPVPLSSPSPEQRELTPVQISNISLTPAPPTATETADAGATKSPNPDERGWTPVQLMSTTAPTASKPAAANTSDDWLTEPLQPKEFDFLSSVGREEFSRSCKADLFQGRSGFIMWKRLLQPRAPPVAPLLKRGTSRKG